LSPKSIILASAVALIDADGRVLIADRPPGKSFAGYWEFPGGKLEAGETPEAGLIRELKEELGITVEAECLAPFTFASYAIGDDHVLVTLFVCRKWQGTVTGCEGQNLAWSIPARLTDYALLPADIPWAAMLRDLLA
jgi:8-oxo-dGTP diphosphatase